MKHPTTMNFTSSLAKSEPWTSWSEVRNANLSATRAQLFKTNDVVKYVTVVKTLIFKYGIYTNIFAEKMWVAFAIAKATHIFSAKLPVNKILCLLEQLTFWPLTSSLS